MVFTRKDGIFMGYVSFREGSLKNLGSSGNFCMQPMKLARRKYKPPNSEVAVMFGRVGKEFPLNLRYFCVERESDFRTIVFLRRKVENLNRSSFDNGVFMCFSFSDILYLMIDTLALKALVFSPRSGWIWEIFFLMFFSVCEDWGIHKKLGLQNVQLKQFWVLIESPESLETKNRTKSP